MNTTTSRRPPRVAGAVRLAVALIVATIAVLVLSGCVTTGQSDPDQAAAAVEVRMERVVGTWSGALDVQGQSLPLVFHIAQDDGALSATMDSPAQNATGIPVQSVEFDGVRLTLDLAALAADYRGELTEAGDVITGTFCQSGLEFELVLTQQESQADASSPAASGARTEPADAPRARPQHPEPPYPYVSEDVRFPSADGTFELAGTITRPDGDGPFPGIVLISGSGQQNRDEEILGHKPFLVLADALTRAGVAVLRYDDRGVGDSGGRATVANATSLDFTGDAAAAVSHLRAQPYAIADRVGVLGHSEGGLIAALMASGRGIAAGSAAPGTTPANAAARDGAASNPVAGDPSFVVFMAAAAVPGDELLMMQSRALLEAGGAGEAYIDEIARANRQVYDLLLSDTPRDEVADQIARIQRELGMNDAQIQAQRQALLSPWFEYFLRADPGPALRDVDVPVLAVYGALDRQVPSGPNATAMEAALAAAPTSDVTVRELEGLNHLLQPATTGGVEEYERIETTVDPAALELIIDWVADRFVRE